jgi:hypothetical protein
MGPMKMQDSLFNQWQKMSNLKPLAQLKDNIDFTVSGDTYFPKFANHIPMILGLTAMPSASQA